VFSVPSAVPAAERARWLAELSEALDEARHLLINLDLQVEQRAEAHDLFLRIEALKFEVQSLRLSRSLNPRAQTDPNRTSCLPE
jgi:hypothetical protein